VWAAELVQASSWLVHGQILCQRTGCPPEHVCIRSPEGLAAVDDVRRVQQLAASRDVTAIRQRVGAHSILDVLQCKQAEAASVCWLLSLAFQLLTKSTDKPPGPYDTRLHHVQPNPLQNTAQKCR
jgi:hypothetical protein